MLKIHAMTKTETKNTVVRFDVETHNKLRFIMWHSSDIESQNKFIVAATKKAIAEYEKKNKITITDKELKEARIID